MSEVNESKTNIQELRRLFVTILVYAQVLLINEVLLSNKYQN